MRLIIFVKISLRNYLVKTCFDWFFCYLFTFFVSVPPVLVQAAKRDRDRNERWTDRERRDTNCEQDNTNRNQDRGSSGTARSREWDTLRERERERHRDRERDRDRDRDMTMCMMETPDPLYVSSPAALLALQRIKEASL